MKVSVLAGIALDWAVAKAMGEIDTSVPIGNKTAPAVYADAEGFNLYSMRNGRVFSPSTNWEIGGPIIEREAISVIRCNDEYGQDEQGFCNNKRIPLWCASIGQNSLECSTEHQQHDAMYQIFESEVVHGPTPLIAAMRCYVASKLGKDIEIPEELTRDPTR